MGSRSERQNLQLVCHPVFTVSFRLLYTERDWNANDSFWSGFRADKNLCVLRAVRLGAFSQFKGFTSETIPEPENVHDNQIRPPSLVRKNRTVAFSSIIICYWFIFCLRPFQTVFSTYSSDRNTKYLYSNMLNSCHHSCLVFRRSSTWNLRLYSSCRLADSRSPTFCHVHTRMCCSIHMIYQNRYLFNSSLIFLPKLKIKCQHT